MTYVIEATKGELWFMSEHTNTAQRVRTGLSAHDIRMAARRCRDYSGENTVILEEGELEKILPAVKDLRPRLEAA